MNRVMKMSDNLYDINVVCNLLGTTSRTLRFYEEKQIIASAERTDSSRRQYTSSQIEQIRNVLVLRSLGLSVKEIRSLQKKDGNLRSAIELNRAKIYACIAEKVKTLHLLNEALALLENGRDVFERNDERSIVPDKEREKMVQICTGAIVDDDADTLYLFLSDKLRAYMPKEVYKKIREDTLNPLGAFIGVDRMETVANFPNIIVQYVRYEKLGLMIKYVFCNEKISGLWFHYYEP